MTLTVFNNELLATGNFSKCGNIEVSNIAKWNNNIWQSVNNITLSNRTYSSAIYKNEFHIAGESDSNESDSHSYYAIWNGIAWSFNNFLFDLILTSPPYFTAQSYPWDNWLREWLLGFDFKDVRKETTQTANVQKYSEAMFNFLKESHRVLKKGKKWRLLTDI